MENNKLLQGALLCATMGLYVFPVKPGQKSPASKGWQSQPTTDPETIKKWWAENPNYNIGIATGAAYGLLVVDYDVANGKQGLKVRNDWRAAHQMPQTWTARTGRGGLHEYYKISEPMGNRTGLYGCVDMRADGGLVLAPPSVVNGNVYAWENPPLIYPLAAFDDNVSMFIQSAPQSAQNGAKRAAYKAPAQFTEGTRTSSLVALIGSLRAKGLDPETIRAAVENENELKGNPPLSSEELEREVFPALYRESWETDTAPYTHDLPINAALLEKVRALDPANNKRYGMNDAGSARLFIDVCGDTVQYVEDRKKWVSYDGNRWNTNGENIGKEKLKALADALYIYALSIQDEQKKTEYMKYTGKWQQLRTRETILKDAASVRPAKSADFDKNPYLLNCLNGTLNLKTGEFHPHTPADMLSRIASVAYDPFATSPRWYSFMDEVTAGDKDLQQYIQKALGYSLTGDTRHECFFILHGATSRNGKSTLTETFSHMMGDYAANARPETLAKKKYVNGSAPNEDIARLAGVRFVNTSEPPKNMELDSSLVKSLTGRDTITARRLNEGSFEFTPQFKLFFNTNHRPRVDDMTVFESERIKMIPFTVHFGSERRDPYLKDKLQTAESLSGVLNWCIDGLKALRESGFKVPQAVAEATAEYRRKEDKLQQFLEDKTEAGDGFEVLLTQLYSSFSDWCCSSGLAPVGIPKFRELLEERQIPLKRKRPTDKTIGKNPVWMALDVRLKQE